MKPWKSKENTMKTLIAFLLTLLISTSALAGMKGSIGTDFVANQTRYQETQTYQVNGSQTYNVDRVQRNDSVNIRFLVGYDLELTDYVDIGLASSYSTNNTLRHDLVAKFKPSDSVVNLKAGPSYTTFLKANEVKQAVGMNFGSEIDFTDSTFLDLNLNISQFQGPETTVEGTVTTGLGMRF